MQNHRATPLPAQGRAIKSLAAARGVTLTQVAAALGLTVQGLSWWLNGPGVLDAEHAAVIIRAVEVAAAQQKEGMPPSL